MTHGLMFKERVLTDQLSDLQEKTVGDVKPEDSLPNELIQQTLIKPFVRILCDTWADGMDGCGWRRTETPQHDKASYTRQKKLNV